MNIQVARPKTLVTMVACELGRRSHEVGVDVGVCRIDAGSCSCWSSCGGARLTSSFGFGGVLKPSIHDRGASSHLFLTKGSLVIYGNLRLAGPASCCFRPGRRPGAGQGHRGSGYQPLLRLFLDKTFSCSGSIGQAFAMTGIEGDEKRCGCCILLMARCVLGYRES